MLQSSRLVVLVGVCTSMTMLVVACLDNSNTPSAPGVDGGRLDAQTSKTDSASPEAGGDDTSTPPKDASTPTEAGSIIDGSASDGAVGLGSTFGPALYGAASDDGSAILISAGSGSPMTIPIRWSQYEPGAGWSTPADIAGSKETWDPNRRPAIAIDNSGNAFLAWTGYDASAISHVSVTRFDRATKTWSAPVKPDTYAQQVSPEIALAVSPAGEAMILTAHNGASAAREISVLHYAAGAWKSELVVTQTAGVIGTPHVAHLFDNGHAAVAWTGSGGQALATRSTAGVWTAGPPLGSVGLSDFSDIALNTFGDVLFAYSSSSSPAVYQYSAAGSAWTGPTSLGTSSNSTSVCLAAAVAPNGDAVVTHCYQAVQNGPPLVEAFAFASKTWGASKALTTSGRVFGFQAVYDAAANAIAMWLGEPGGTGGAAAPEVSTYSIAGGWTAESSPLTDVFDFNGQVIAPIVTPSGGDAWAAWTQGGAAYVQRIH